MTRYLVIQLLLLISFVTNAQSEFPENKLTEEDCKEIHLVKENNNLKIDIGQQCFDDAMKLWFHSFILLQEDGYDMRQADNIAYQEAGDSLVICSPDLRTALATDAHGLFPQL